MNSKQWNDNKKGTCAVNLIEIIRKHIIPAFWLKTRMQYCKKFFCVKDSSTNPLAGSILHILLKIFVKPPICNNVKHSTSDTKITNKVTLFMEQGAVRVVPLYLSKPSPAYEASGDIST